MARKDQASGFGVNILNRKGKKERRDCTSSCKTAVCCEGDDVCNCTEDLGRGRSQEARTGVVLKAIFQCH